MWGHKVTLHIYVEGEQHGDGCFEAAAAAHDAIEADGQRVDFVGVSIEPVEDKPTHQVA